MTLPRLLYPLLLLLALAPSLFYACSPRTTSPQRLPLELLLPTVEKHLTRGLSLNHPKNRRVLSPLLKLLDSRGVLLRLGGSTLSTGHLNEVQVERCFSTLGNTTQASAGGYRCLRAPGGVLFLAVTPPHSPPLSLPLLLGLALPPLFFVLLLMGSWELQRFRLRRFGRHLKLLADPIPGQTEALPWSPELARGGSEIAALYSALAVLAALLRQQREHLREQLKLNKKRQRALKLSQDQFVSREKLVLVGRLAAGFAHEIGNPVAALMGLTDLMATEELPEETKKKNLALMEGELQRMDTLLRKLLLFAKPESSPPTGQSLSRLVERAVALTKASRRGSPMEYIVEIPDLPPIAGHNGLLQVLVNLLLNAAQAQKESPNPGVRLFVDPPLTVRDQKRRTLTLYVLDRGPGVSQEVVETLFEPFVTTKDPGEGTGLGLTVSRMIVEELGGELFLEPTTTGACFGLTLPLFEPPEEKHPPFFG